MNNCPFYGRAMFSNTVVPVKILLLDTRGNQCAIVTDRHAPCWMETSRQPIDWRECPLMKDMRMEPL